MTSSMSRKQFLRLSLLAGAGLAVPACSADLGGGIDLGDLGGGGGANVSTEGSAGALLSSELDLPEPFQVRLPVPPVLEPVRTDGGTDYYEITQRAAQIEIIPGTTTEVWGYDGIFPGPTIESRSGRGTTVTHTNELGVPVGVHLHGGHTPPEHDGYPTELIEPVGGGGAGTGHSAQWVTLTRGSKDYVYPMDQQAATLWYHDHRMDFTGPQVYRGLAGFHLVRDDVEDALRLPSGDREIPLMIADRSFAADGSFLYPSLDPSLMGDPGVSGDYMSGVLGDCILVNGAPWPVHEVSNTKHRLRILNASNARRYQLELDPAPGNGPSFLQIGSDQGLLGSPVEHDDLVVTQAERFDVIVDFSQYDVGDEVTLRNRMGSGGTQDVMRFVVGREEADSGPIPDRLADYRQLSEDQAVAEREFVLQRGGAEMHGVSLWTINGEAFDPNVVLASPAAGSVERWRVRGQNVEHPWHIHLASFQVLSRDGNEPSRYDAGWKDTVSLENGSYVDLLVRFGTFRGKYVMHCHNLEHEDMMMMSNFETV